MSITYTTYVNQISNLMAASSTTQQFQTMLPGMIDYAEQRIYRELDLLSTVIRDADDTFIANNRYITFSQSTGTIITLQDVNVITPISATSADNGTRNQLQPVARDFLDAVYGSSSNSGIPKFFAMLNNIQIMVGPWPDQNYIVELIGTTRPAPLSITNTNTFLTQYLPDLFISASMIFASGYMRNFGASSDNPQMAQSWEQQYEKLFASANAEEMRKKFSGPGWTSFSNVATPAER